METIEIQHTTGTRIRSLREARRWTQEELASASGIPQYDISKLENGRRRIGLKYAQKLGRAFDVPYHSLIEPIIL